MRRALPRAFEPSAVLAVALTAVVFLVLVESSAYGLTCDFAMDMIGGCARLRDLPAAGHGAVLAGVARPLFRD
jgi:hypothetical protein